MFLFGSWDISGGCVDVICGVLYYVNFMVFDGVGVRWVCILYLDIRLVGNFRFYFGFGKLKIKLWYSIIYIIYLWFLNK